MTLSEKIKKEKKQREKQISPLVLAGVLLNPGDRAELKNPSYFEGLPLHESKALENGEFLFLI